MLEEKIEEAIRTELRRQADERPQELSVSGSGTRLEIRGPVDLVAVAVAIAGAVAGGP